MTCDRCQDIHQAQREGKTNQSCHCNCHYYSSSNTQPLFCTCGTGGTTVQCPVHPFSLDNSAGGSYLF